MDDKARIALLRDALENERQHVRDMREGVRLGGQLAKELGKLKSEMVFAEEVIRCAQVLRSVTDRSSADEWHIQLFNALDDYESTKKQG